MEQKLSKYTASTNAYLSFYSVFHRLYNTEAQLIYLWCEREGGVPPVCSTVRHCAAHCTEQMFVPVETDKRTATNCTWTFEESARTDTNMCAYSNFRWNHSDIQHFWVCAHPVLLPLLEGKHMSMRAHCAALLYAHMFSTSSAMCAHKSCVHLVGGTMVSKGCFFVCAQQKFGTKCA